MGASGAISYRKLKLQRQAYAQQRARSSDDPE
jgi:hypothetical protein